MSEETEQDIARRIHKISTQIENIKATQLNTEQLTAVIRSANAQVRHIGRQQNELSTDDFQQACEMVKDTAEKLDYWESRYKMVLDIIEEWDKDFIQLKADYEMLTEADGKTNKDAEYWKQRYKELNKKFDNNAVKFTDAKLKSDAIAISYDELSETLHAVEQERDQYKEKYEVTKKLLDAETSAEHTGSDSYNELYKENQQLCAALDKKEDQIDGLFKEAKLLTETKVSLVNELLDLKYLIHKLRLDDEASEDVTNADDTNKDES